MKKAQRKASEVIKPLIRSNDEQHILEAIFDGDEEDMPVVKSVGYTNLRTGPNSWISYTITTKGREVISFEVSEPDARLVAEDGAKIAFVQEFTNVEF